MTMFYECVCVFGGGGGEGWGLFSLNFSCDVNFNKFEPGTLPPLHFSFRSAHGVVIQNFILIHRYLDIIVYMY